MRIKFWRWAHGAAERLWHWIYYHRLPEGIGQRKLAAAARKQGGWTYTFSYVNSKTGEIALPSNDIKIYRTDENANGA